MARGQDNGALWLDLVVLNPWFRLGMVPLGAIAIGMTLHIHHTIPPIGVRPFLTDDDGRVWASVGLGLGLGAVVAAWERFQLTRRRGERLALSRLPFEERLRWKHWSRNMAENGWILVGMFAVMGWCIWARVFPLAAMAAMTLPGLANWRLITGFARELEESRRSPPEWPSDVA